MDPIDEFHESLGLFNASMVAHMARILERHGLLDDETRRLIHYGLRQLEETAAKLEGSHDLSDHVDLLLSILPAGKP